MIMNKNNSKLVDSKKNLHNVHKINYDICLFELHLCQNQNGLSAINGYSKS